MSRWTRKHYERTVEVLGQWSDTLGLIKDPSPHMTKQEIRVLEQVEIWHDEFSLDNERFDGHKFVKACLDRTQINPACIPYGNLPQCVRDYTWDAANARKDG
jgi:hypothetical protein